MNTYNPFREALGAIEEYDDEGLEALAEMKAGIHTKIHEDIERAGITMTESIKAIIPIAARAAADIREDRRVKQNVGDKIQRRFPYSRKGVTLAGGVGCGKTVALRALGLISKAKIISIPELALKFSSGGIDRLMEEFKPLDYSGMSNFGKNNFIIDDLGAEQIMKNYGQQFPIEEIIMKRYNEWISKGYITHFATNLNGHEIAERYGERISSRIAEMTKIVVIKGESMRNRK